MNSSCFQKTPVPWLHKQTIKTRKICSTEKVLAGKSFTATMKDWSEKKPNQFTEFWRPIRTVVPVPSTGDWCPSRCDMEAAPSAQLSWAIQHWHWLQLPHMEMEVEPAGYMGTLLCRTCCSKWRIQLFQIQLVFCKKLFLSSFFEAPASGVRYAR